ncbi:hypothetical protein CLOM_g10736 [Closterium sp. NIES-68]|nr:hypothetical protein CLOM_g10736 [Closterium sp. NIES-68]GJP65039.1 hypothetical protein CLOP_g21957 [Closterium sp. NIES-67]
MRALSHSNILACFLLAVLLPSLSEAAEVRLQRIKIFQTHDLPFWKPSVYFQCEGEPKRQLDVVVEVNVDYNFTLHEPFQPLTELTAPHCKVCGFYDADTLTDDDAFDRFFLCPLDFKPAFSGRLNYLMQSELNATFICLHCNPERTSRSSGDEFEGTGINHPNPLYAIFLGIGLVTCLSYLTVLVVSWLKSGAWPLYRRRMDSDTSRFMEMFEEEDGRLTMYLGWPGSRVGGTEE